MRDTTPDDELKIEILTEVTSAGLVIKSGVLPDQAGEQFLSQTITNSFGGNSAEHLIAHRSNSPYGNDYDPNNDLSVNFVLVTFTHRIDYITDEIWE